MAKELAERAVETSVTDRLRNTVSPDTRLGMMIAHIPADADERTAMRFCIEMGPNLDDKNLQLTPQECEERAQLAACFEGHEHRSVLLAPVIQAAYDPTSPLRMAALSSLANTLEDPAAKTVLAQVRRELVDQQRKKLENTAIRIVNPMLQ